MHVSTILLACILYGHAFCLSSNPPNPAVSPRSQKWTEVRTTNGWIRGHRAPGSEAVIEYLGIPFAKPPVGDLRFAPPERFVGNSSYEASQFVSCASSGYSTYTDVYTGIVRAVGRVRFVILIASSCSDCPLSPSRPVDYPGFTPQAQQIIRYFASGAGTPQSEDCLTLNVWSRPTEIAKKQQKPVLVFFYGGRKTP